MAMRQLALVILALAGMVNLSVAQTTDGQGNTNVKIVPSGQTPQWGPLQVGAPISQPLPTVATSQYPIGAIPTNGSNIGTTAAVAASIAARAGFRSWICGFYISANATSAVDVTATLANVNPAGNVQFAQWVGPVATANGVLSVPFSPCLPSVQVNQAITVTSGAAGTSGNTSVTVWGYYQ